MEEGTNAFKILAAKATRKRPLGYLDVVNGSKI
jgi:hypothetical protein